MVEHQEEKSKPGTNEVLPAKDEEHIVSDDDVLKDAQQRTVEEHSMPLMEGLRKYPKACFYSALFNAALIMEGFDKAFMTTFFTFPPFKKRYGSLSSDGTYQVPADI